MITWVAPDSQNSPITKYKVEVRTKSTLSWYEDLTNCNGANAIIVSNTRCQIPMSVITGANLLYLANDLVTVRVSAFNLNGWGPTSSLNTVGALACTVPQTMAPPVRASGTGENEITLSWSPLSSLSQTGGSAILSYYVQWN